MSNQDAMRFKQGHQQTRKEKDKKIHFPPAERSATERRNFLSAERVKCGGQGKGRKGNLLSFPEI